MISPRDAAIQAVRPIVAQATERVPPGVALVLPVAEIVDAVLGAAHPGALIPPRHRPEDEDLMAYRISAELPGIAENLPPLYFAMHVDTARSALDWRIVENLNGTPVGRDAVIATGTTSLANMRLLGMALVAAADHGTRVQAAEHAERIRLKPATDTEQEK